MEHNQIRIYLLPAALLIAAVLAPAAPTSGSRPAFTNLVLQDQITPDLGPAIPQTLNSTTPTVPDAGPVIPAGTSIYDSGVQFQSDCKPPAPVPEPSSASLGAAGGLLLLLGSVRRRRA